MKKFLALVLAVLMIASTVVSVAAFDDVAADNKYANAIEELQEYGVVAGKSETEFAPDELVTRWQMALFMARATSGETDDEAWNIGASLFTDCTQYLGAIQYCYTKGIIKGVTATEFAPNANITLRDGVIMAVRALNYEKEDEYVEASAKKYTVTGANYWLPYWQKADEIGMLENLKDLSVTAELTRAQTVQLIYNMLNSVVYNYDVNGYKYTLEEVVFGGKQVVNVDNVTGAWISETPLQSIGADTIGEDEEIVVLTVNDENTYATVEVPFADLEKAGVDVENIEEYFGAYIELVNCRVDNTHRDEDQEITYIYKEYEYLAGVNTENKLVTTDADVVYHKNGDRVRIDSKTHYFDESEKVRNYLAVYTVTDPADGWELVEDFYTKVGFDDEDGDGLQDDDEESIYEVTTINDQLEGKFYDVTFIDTDVDGYYEVALVNYYNLDTYKAPKSNGKETFGVMKDVEAEDTEYSEDLSAGDVFVYTYDFFMNTVDVKGVLEVYEGEITSYSDKKVEDIRGNKYTVATIEINDEEYEVSFYGASDKTVDAFSPVIDAAKVGEDDEIDLEKVTKAGVADFASTNVGGEYEYYLFNDMLLAFGKEVELAADNYLVVEEFTDFELYDHVVLSALVNGTEEEIKVKKIYEKKESGVKKVWADIEDLGYGKLANKLEDIFGIYSYAVDEDGFYTLTKHTATLQLKDFVSTVEEFGYVSFSDWETTAVVDTNANGNSREEIIRVNSATTIYLVDVNEQDVTMVKPSSYFTINLNNDTDPTFMIDRIGYGNTEKEYADGIGFGVASVIYIVTDGEYINHEDYKFVYVQDAVSSISSGSATKYELETGDEEEKYFKYIADDSEAYLATVTFEDVEEIFVSKTYRTNYLGGADLVPGLYLLNSDNIVMDHKTVAELNSESSSDTYLTYDKAQIDYDIWTVAGDEINLYDYKYKTIDCKSGLIGDRIQTIKFRFFEKVDGEKLATDLKDEKLVDYMTENFCTITKVDPEDKSTWTYDYEGVKVLIIPNTTTGFNKNLSFISNTLAGIVFAEEVIG